MKTNWLGPQRAVFSNVEAEIVDLGTWSPGCKPEAKAQPQRFTIKPIALL